MRPASTGMGRPSRSRSSTGEQKDNCPTLVNQTPFSQWLGTSNVDNSLLRTHTSAYTRKYSPAFTFASLYDPHSPWFAGHRACGIGNRGST